MLAVMRLTAYQFAFPGAGKGLPDRNASLNSGPAWPALATDNPFPTSSDKTDE